MWSVEIQDLRSVSIIGRACLQAVTGGGGALVTKLYLTFVTPWTVAHQASLSVGFSRQEYWSPFISIMHHFLKQNGVNVSRDQLNDCYHILVEHNPWFPEEGTLDLDVWKRVKNNILRAYRQGLHGHSYGLS